MRRGRQYLFIVAHPEREYGAGILQQGQFPSFALLDGYLRGCCRLSARLGGPAPPGQHQGRPTSQLPPRAASMAPRSA